MCSHCVWEGRSGIARATRIRDSRARPCSRARVRAQPCASAIPHAPSLHNSALGSLATNVCFFVWTWHLRSASSSCSCILALGSLLGRWSLDLLHMSYTLGARLHSCVFDKSSMLRSPRPFEGHFIDHASRIGIWQLPLRPPGGVLIMRSASRAQPGTEGRKAPST